MALTELPSELFRMKNVKTLSLYRNYISSLPSEIAHMTKLEGLEVRLSKRLVRDLTKSHAQVTNNLLVSLPPELGLLTNLKRLYVRHSREMDLALTQRRVLSGQRKPPDVAASGNRPTGTARAARSMKFEVSREPDLVCACAQVYNNQLKWLPAELGQLSKLSGLWVRRLVSFVFFPDSSSSAALRKSTTDDRRVAV